MSKKAFWKSCLARGDLQLSEKEMDEGGQFSFYKDSDGKWWRTQRAWRCCEEVMFSGQCQGLLNHEGVHWVYSRSGDFCWNNSQAGYSGQTPPSHAMYKDPLLMRALHYTQKECDRFLIEDPDEIARLEAGDLEEGESTIRSVDGA